MNQIPASTASIGGFLGRLRRQLAGVVGGLPNASRTGSMHADSRTPDIDLIDRGDAFVVLADLPGFETDDLSVTVTDGTLTIEGSCDGTAHRSGRYLKQEREGSTMRRRVPFPEPVNPDAVTTDYRRGVVQVVVEKVADDATNGVDAD
jgi:HSP20 family protein